MKFEKFLEVAEIYNVERKCKTEFNWEESFFDSWHIPEEREKIEQAIKEHNLTVWTFINGEGSSMPLLRGYKMIDRLGYLFTYNSLEELEGEEISG